MSEQEIETAIATLTRLRDESTPGSWVVDAEYGPTIHSTADHYSPIIDAGDFAASSESFENIADASLIVTLHRTIDAQIKLLTGTLLYRAKYLSANRLNEWQDAIERAGDLDLARAINNIRTPDESETK